MSTKDRKTKANQKPVEDGTIIDADVVEDAMPEKPAAEKPTSEGQDILQTKPNKAKGSRTARLGWIFALAFATFITGLWAAPYLKEGLVWSGLREAENQVKHPIDTLQNIVVRLQAQAENINSTQTGIAALNADLQTVTIGLTDRITALENAPARAPKTNEASAVLSVAERDQLNRLQMAQVALGEQIQALKTQMTNDQRENHKEQEHIDITVLRQSLASLTQQNAHFRATLENLQRTVGRIKSAADARTLTDHPRGRMLLLIARLKDQALKGAAFTSDVAALRAETNDARSAFTPVDQQRIGAVIARLDTPATTGIWTYSSLVNNFGTVTQDILNTEAQAKGSWLSGLFTVRRTDATALGVDAIVRDAELALLARDVLGSVLHLETLPETSKAVAMPWITAAKNHVSVLGDLDQLTNMIAAQPQTESQGQVQ